MGTFIGTFTVSNTTAAIQHSGGKYFVNTGGIGLSGTVTFALSGACFSLDGNPAISFASLPAGFTPSTSCILRKTGTGSTPIGYVEKNGSDTAHADVQLSIFGPTSTDANVDNTPVLFNALDFVHPRPIAGSDLGSSLTVNLSVVHITGNPALLTSVVYDTIEISGSYTNVNYQYSLNNSQFIVSPGNNLLPKGQPVKLGNNQIGDLITISSLGPNASPVGFDLSHVSLATITYIDGSGNPQTITINSGSFLNWTVYLIQFYIPNSFGADKPPIVFINITGDGTQFSGSVPLGKLETIYFKNAPGIYFLDPTATHDTLYDVVNGGTVNVSILSPFVKTGYIGG